MTRQWLELTISAYRSRITCLPHCTRLCYPERNASSFLNHLCRIYFSLKIGFRLPNSIIIIQTFSQKKTRNLVAMAVRVPIPIPFNFVVLCRCRAPLAASIYRVCTLPPDALRKGFWLYKKVGHLNTCSLNSGPIAQVLT